MVLRVAGVKAGRGRAVHSVAGAAGCQAMGRDWAVFGADLFQFRSWQREF